jgi:hypothetical protein
MRVLISTAALALTLAGCGTSDVTPAGPSTFLAGTVRLGGLRSSEKHEEA